jgi:hypothetical protein
MCSVRLQLGQARLKAGTTASFAQGVFAHRMPMMRVRISGSA